MKLYYNIVFIDESADSFVGDFLAGTVKNAVMLEYLKSWDYGNESEHSPQPEPSHGGNDEIFESGDYILSWNTGLGYVGLDRVSDA